MTGAQPAGFTAVIADDDPDIATLMEIAVRRAGGTVLAVAHDGTDAWDRIRELGPDLALLDVSMPGLTGVEVCRLVRDNTARADGAGPLVVLLSAAVHPAAVAQGLEAGAERYLAKPFSPRSLAEELTRALRAKGNTP